jgi:hypothetical protein
MLFEPVETSKEISQFANALASEFVSTGRHEGPIGSIKRKRATPIWKIRGICALFA